MNKANSVREQLSNIFFKFSATSAKQNMKLDQVTF